MRGKKKRERRSRQALFFRSQIAAEVLEDRTLLAVDAFLAMGVGGTPTLFVFDDSDFIGSPNQTQDNTVTISRSGDLVRISDPLGVFTDASAAATGPGFAEFNVAAFDALHIDLQDGNDTLAFAASFTSAGSGGAITVDLAAQTVTESGFGPVSFVGIEEVRVNANGGDVSVVATAGADELALTPLPDDHVRIELAGLNATLNVSAAGALTIDPLGGADVVSYQGRVVADDISLTFGATTTIANAGLQTVGVGSASTELLKIFGADGNDNIVLQGDATILPGAMVDGGAGNDRIDASLVTTGAFIPTGVVLLGGSGDDTITGGAGDDRLEGGDGRDTFVGNGGNDTFDGGAGVDTILVQGTSGDDAISVIQTAATTLVHTVNADTQTDTLVTLAGVRTVEVVRVEAGGGLNTISATWADALGVDADVNSLRIDVIGGPALTQDSLGVIDDGTGDLILFRHGQDSTAGSMTIGPGNAEPLELTFEGIDAARPIVAAGGDVVVFKHDPFEFNGFRSIATHLGANEVVNFDPTIDPGLDPVFGFPADQDFYRVQALATGTLDFQVLFDEFPTVPSGRPGLPGAGNLNIFVFDVNGDLIAGNGPAFGGNDGGGLNPELNVDGEPNQEDERIRIPAVQGQTYFLQVVGASPQAINQYNLTIVNTPAPVPFDIELDDHIFEGMVVAGVSPIQFSGDASLPAIDDFFNGKVVSFGFTTATAGLRGQEAVVLDYVGATRTFLLGLPLSATPAAGDAFHIESVDTGRSSTENVTRDDTPTVFFRIDDAAFLNDLPGNSMAGTPPDEVIPIPFRAGPAQPTEPGYAIAVFDEGATAPASGFPVGTPLGFATMVEPGLYTFTVPDGAPLSEGSHFISARVQMIDPADSTQTGFGPRSASLEIVVDNTVPPVSYGDPEIAGDGLTPDGVRFVLPGAGTQLNLVTNDLTPTFWGRAEANAIVRLFADTYRDNNGNGVFDAGDVAPNGIFDPDQDVFIGQTTALPLDGNQQEPNGSWQIESVVNFSDPRFFLEPGGLRTVFVTAEDVAGNINDSVAPQELDIFVDAQGPQVFDPDGPLSPAQHAIEVQTRNSAGVLVENPAFNLFDLKPTAGPTPRIDGLSINIIDLPERIGAFLGLLAIKRDIATAPGNIRLVGDFVGNVAIEDIRITFGLSDGIAGVPGFEPDADPNTGFATAEITLEFSEPLQDDRYTLVLSDSLVDFAGNPLDGESDASQPRNNPTFPSGDGVPGGESVARFTVDSRPEVAVFGQAGTVVDANGNFRLDGLVVGGQNYDVSRDLQFNVGVQTDHVFAGQFKPAGRPTVNGYDRIGAYGLLNGQYRFLLDFNDNGRIDSGETIVSSRQVSGLPVAGNFDANPLAAPVFDRYDYNPLAADVGNGDEIGLFDGVNWYLDTTGDNTLNTTIAGNLRGLPLVGDFDGDGLVDLGTYSATANRFFFSLSSAGGSVFHGNSNVTHTFDFGFPGGLERPFAHDFNLDGITDFGLTTPSQPGTTQQLEWYVLVSDLDLRQQTGAALPFRRFSPTPLENDLFFLYGNNASVPVVGNFDPPLGPDQNAAPYVPAIDQSVSHTQGMVTIPLPQLDADGDIIHYDVAIGTAFDALAEMAYQLDQALDLTFMGDYSTNWGGAGEVWMMGDTGWHFLTPTGDLYHWNGSRPGPNFLPGSTLVGTLGPIYYDMPELLHDPEPPGTADPPPEINVQLLDGHVIVITGNPQYVGDVVISVTGSDGVAIAAEDFTITYTNSIIEIELPPQELVHDTPPLIIDLPELDADGDLLEYEAYLIMMDALAQLAWQLDQQYNFTFTGSYSTNWGGANEHWLQSANSGWHFITPNGTLYRWKGSRPGSGFLPGSTPVATFNASYYADPARLYNPPASGGDAGGSTVAVVNNQLVVTPGPSFTGQLNVGLAVSDGLERRTIEFPVSVVNRAPVLSIPNQRLPHDAGPLVIDLPATDADGDAVTYTAELQTGGPLAQLAYGLDRRLGLRFTGSYTQNWGGANERWLQSGSNAWHFITPDGRLFRWTGSRPGSAFLSGSTLVATLGASYWTDPARLYDAQPPSGDAGGSTVEVRDGRQLVVTPATGFVGLLRVTATASDGVARTTAAFTVDVTNTAPPLDVPALETADGRPLVITLPGTDADGDALTYAAELVDPLADLARNLDQRLGLRFTGSYAQNWGGANERWMLSASNTWYFITPNGRLYRWTGSRPGSSFLAGSTAVATLDSTYWADPARLHDAPPPGGSSSAAGGSVSVSGNQITVTPVAGFSGPLYVRIRVTDGIATVSRTVTVSAVETGPIDDVFANWDGVD